MKGKGSEIRDAVLLEGKIWFFYREYRYLFSMDVKTGETRTYEIPTVGNCVHKDAFASMALVGRKLYLVPFCDSVIMQFDIDSEKFKKVELDERIIHGKSKLFWSVGKCGQYLFIMGAYVPVILRVNTVNNHIDYITDWRQQVEDLIFDSQDIYFRRQCVVVNDKLFVPFCNANAILEVDCISMETVVHRLGDKQQGYSGICLEEDSLWLSPRRNGDVVKWNMATKQIDTITASELQITREQHWYIGIVASNNKKLLFPVREKSKVCIEKKNVEELYGSFVFFKDDGTHAFYSEKGSEIITVVELTSGKRLDLKLGKVDIDIAGVLSENNNFIVENATIGIRNFIKYVSTNTF